MQLIGYARISTEDQTNLPQSQALKSAGCAEIHEEQASGGHRARPVLASVLERIGQGDTLVVVVPPEQGYGVRNEELVDTASLSQFPNPEQVEVGVSFRVQMGDMMYVATVTDIAGDTVTFDISGILWPGQQGGSLIMRNDKNKRDTLWVSAAGLTYRR